MNSLRFHLIELQTIDTFISCQNLISFKLLIFMICHLQHKVWFLTQLIGLKIYLISTLLSMDVSILEVLLVLHSFFCDLYLTCFCLWFSFFQLILTFCLIIFLLTFFLKPLLELFSLFALPMPFFISIFYFIQFQPISFCLQPRNFYYFYFYFYFEPIFVCFINFI